MCDWEHLDTLDLFFSKQADFPLNFKHSHVLIVGQGAAKYAFTQHFRLAR